MASSDLSDGATSAIPVVLVKNLWAERDRWSLWPPVAFAAGVGLYFAGSEETPPWAPLILAALALIVFRWLADRQTLLALVLIGLAAVSSGFALTSVRTLLVAAPVLERETRVAITQAEVLWVERRASGYRLLMSHPTLAPPHDGLGLVKARVKVSAKAAQSLKPGEWVALDAVLRPPPEPAAPGAYDFGRRAYFEQLGAVGYGWGLERLPPPAPADLAWAQASGVSAGWRLFWAEFRHRLGSRVQEALPGQPGAVATALMTGDRSALSQESLTAMRDSGLAHLLAISGLHMGLVAGLVFLLTRGLFALVPRLVLFYPTKKWAAGLALVAAFLFLFVAGATVPTQRAFLMVSVVLFAVMLDRRALSLRLVAWAAVAVLAIAPESLLSASYQMSFGAVIALIATYERVAQGRLFPYGERGLVLRVGLYLGAVALTSLVATLATGPFAVFHFNRLVVYGPLANLLAVPLTAFWIMPCALGAYLTAPLGWEAVFLVPMGWGIELLLTVARSVAAWPHAQLSLPAMPTGALVTAVMGGLWLAIWRRRWRLWGLPVIVAALVYGLTRPPPDIWISGDARLMAFRLQDTLYLSTLRRNRFEAEVWQRRAGLEQVASWDALAESRPDLLRCDTLGCILTLEGRKIAFVSALGALDDDCPAVQVLASREPVPPWLCPEPQLVVDRFDLWRGGATVISWDDDTAQARSAASERGRRAWVQRRGREADQ